MHKDVRPDAGIDWQAGQKLTVGLGNGADQRILEWLKPKTALVQEIVYVDAIGQKRLATAEIQPVHVVLRIFEKIAEELLVIAAKRDATQRRLWWSQQVFQNAAGIAPAIDVVTQENDQSRRRVASHVRKDFPFRMQEQIQAAVHIANGVDRKGYRPVAKVYSAPPPVVAEGRLFTTANPV